MEKDSGGAGVCIERQGRLLKAYIFRDLSFLCESQLGAECRRLFLNEVTHQSL